MPEELTKQAGSIGETLQKIWKDNEAYHPGVYGALGGATFAGLGTMGRRANENPRQRALRIIRNAAAGGLLGGMGTQLAVPGVKKVIDNMAHPNKNEGSKPGFLSSDLARLGYMGGTATAGNKIFRRRSLLNSLQKMLPAEGLGHVAYNKFNPGDEFYKDPNPAKNTARFPQMKVEDNILSSAKRMEIAKLTDLELRNVARNDPKGFKNLIEAIQEKSLAGANGLVDKNLGDFLKANYYRGKGGHPVNFRGILRGLNFMGTSAPNKFMRGVGALGSGGSMWAAFKAPDWINAARETTGEQVGEVPAKLFPNPFAATPAPAAPAEETWIDQLTKGKRY